MQQDLNQNYQVPGDTGQNPEETKIETKKLKIAALVLLSVAALCELFVYNLFFLPFLVYIFMGVSLLLNKVKKLPFIAVSAYLGVDVLRFLVGFINHRYEIYHYDSYEQVSWYRFDIALCLIAFLQLIATAVFFAYVFNYYRKNPSGAFIKNWKIPFIVFLTITVLVYSVEISLGYLPSHWLFQFNNIFGISRILLSITMGAAIFLFCKIICIESGFYPKKKATPEPQFNFTVPTPTVVTNNYTYKGDKKMNENLLYSYKGSTGGLVCLLILSIIFFWLVFPIYLIIVILHTATEVTITDRRIRLKTFGGVWTELPMDQVGSISRSFWFSSYTIRTAAGSIKIYGSADRDKVFELISQRMISRQTESGSSQELPEL